MKKLIALFVILALSASSAEACHGRRAAKAVRAVVSKVRIFKHGCSQKNEKASACANGSCKK